MDRTVSELANWLLDPGRGSDPAIIDTAGVLTRDELRRQVRARAGGAPGPAFLGDGSDRAWVVRYLATLYAGRQVRLCDTAAEAAEGETAVVMQTSGSMGVPLAVPLTAGNLVANGSAIVEALGLTPEDRVLAGLPFSYSFGLSLLHTGLASGGCVVLTAQRGYVRGLLADAETHRATVVGLVPTLARRAALKGGWPSTSDLRMVQVAGGALDEGTTRLLLKTLPAWVSLQVMYGLTEATARVSAFDVRTAQENLGSVGRPIPGVRVHIENADGAAAPAGSRGRIVIGGPGVCRALARDDGCFMTGDVGRLDADGFLWIEGREADFVKVGGTRTSIAPVECAALEVAGVEMAVAVAVPDELAGERVALLVAGTPTGGAEALADALAQTVPRPLLPTQIQVVASVPLTRSGKIDRVRAREVLLSTKGNPP